MTHNFRYVFEPHVDEFIQAASEIGARRIVPVKAEGGDYFEVLGVSIRRG